MVYNSYENRKLFIYNLNIHEFLNLDKVYDKLKIKRPLQELEENDTDLEVDMSDQTSGKASSKKADKLKIPLANVIALMLQKKVNFFIHNITYFRVMLRNWRRNRKRH
jgi:hypothetical protein